MFETTKKVIVEVAGGLGNQMFQYALYLKLISLQYNCKLYYDSSQHIHNGLELNRVFNLNLDFASKIEVDELLDVRQTVFEKIKRNLFGRNISRYWEHDKGYEFKPEILEQSKPVYLQGCWLSDRYFSDIEATIRKAFTFFNPLTGCNLEVQKQIISEVNPVSIHIRRGDYLQSSAHSNINYESYLRNSICQICKKIETPTYYVFSDDMEYATSVLAPFKAKEVFSFIDWNKGLDSHFDMQLMSNCKHNIIANSTFSWWGAWLNNNKGKLVISPAKWFNEGRLNDHSIIPHSWITL